MASLLVAAIGSAHGADSLGWEVADYLSAHLESGHGVLPYCQAAAEGANGLHIIKYQHPTAVVEKISHFSHVLFVDACRVVEQHYGALIHVQADALTPGKGELSSHESGVNDAVCLARALNVLPKHCAVMGLNVYLHEHTPVSWSLQQQLVHALWGEILRVLQPRALPFVVSSYAPT